MRVNTFDMSPHPICYPSFSFIQEALKINLVRYYFKPISPDKKTQQ